MICSKLSPLAQMMCIMRRGRFYRLGDEANQTHLLRKGRVAIEIFAPKQGSLIIQTLSPGDVLGWSWLPPPQFPDDTGDVNAFAGGIKIFMQHASGVILHQTLDNNGAIQCGIEGNRINHLTSSIVL